ncbi:MAG: tRNA lysidine(34) synthetase TilS [Pseudomonas sp.]
MAMDLETRLLGVLAPWRAAPAWRVAFSGGLDSTVLLHVLVRLARRQALPALSAVHIHHGLQAVAEDWPAHCQRICAELGVPLQVKYVQVAAGASLERAAREARYAAFTESLGVDELLLTAQHRDDQAETLLFRLLRGAGVRGLAGMPARRALGRGQLLRPLLAVSRAELAAYAQAQGLTWVEDPSNTDTHYARNYLRQCVLPLLTARWPQASTSLARSAAHLSEAQGLLNELAELDLAAAQHTSSGFAWLPLPSLALAPLQGLSPARQRNALRHWLSPLTTLPDSNHWAGWEDLRDAGIAATPIWRLGQGELHRADGRLWWLAGPWLNTPSMPPSGVSLAPGIAGSIGGSTEWLQLPSNGWVQLRTRPGAPAPAARDELRVRYRQGGEVLQLAQRGHRQLKRLLNERGVPSMLRARLPLLYRGDRLIGVANLPELSAATQEHWQLIWQGPTSDQGLS